MFFELVLVAVRSSARFLLILYRKYFLHCLLSFCNVVSKCSLKTNIFSRNYAMDREGRATVVAGTAGQHYVDNIFFNPDNDYEMITVNRSM